MVIQTSANLQAINRGKKSYPFCGRLIVMDNSNTRTTSDFSKAFSIDFPAMPEQIELARKAEYRVAVNMVMPDGIHQYMSTSPMKIPFSFKIHHGDSEYCTEGPLTLLKLAARFHALVTPLGDSGIAVDVANEAPITDGGTPDPGAKGVGTDAAVNQGAGKSTADTNSGRNTNPSYSSTNRTDPPVVVRLQLITTLIDGPGINCTGYVEDVKVVLFGPWLRGPGVSQNLPSAGEYSFTFVHRPGHGNFFSNKSGGAAVAVQAQAYAQFIRERLYNSADLTANSTTRIRGWADPSKS